MRAYHDIVKQVLARGVPRPNRTGVDTRAIPSAVFQHDMAEGFPLLTTKKTAHRVIRVELEGFIKGVSDKRWYQLRGCHIWDQWCNPLALPPGLGEGLTEERKAAMRAEPDLGPIYGSQWRRFASVRRPVYEQELTPQVPTYFDQLSFVVDQLKSCPDNRALVVSAWNPVQQCEMALPPCHLLFHVLVIGGALHLNWYQRSVDVALGLPFNIASYGILLHLLAKQSGYAEGVLTGMLGDTHIYDNHVAGLMKQLRRDPGPLPRLETKEFTTIFDWEWRDTKIKGYTPHPKISFEVAV